jgi:hypothetical protein
MLNWELTGIAFIFTAGSALHFLFALTGHWRPIAWFAAVNESVWEHLKLTFWPGLIFALIEYLTFGQRYKAFWLAKWLGLLAMTVLIPLLFYGYVAVLGRHNMALDLLIFLITIVAGQLLSYTVAVRITAHQAFSWLGVIGLLAMALTFIVLTYNPLHNFLFRCPQTQQYGIAVDLRESA